MPFYHHYSREEDVLQQAANTKTPRGPDPVWYDPIKRMDTAALDQVLSCYSQEELEQILGWEGAAQWYWHIRTALGYAIWRRNIDAVKLLVLKYGVDVKEDVAQNESSCVHYDGGIRFPSLAYCVEIGAHQPVHFLRKAGATFEDWKPDEVWNLKGPEPAGRLANFWKGGTPEVTQALFGGPKHHQKGDKKGKKINKEKR